MITRLNNFFIKKTYLFTKITYFLECEGKNQNLFKILVSGYQIDKIMTY
jgi:hypothetical protein